MTSNRIKLLIVRTVMGQGGADRVTYNLLQYLDRSKYDLNLVLMKKSGDYISMIPSDVKLFCTNSKNLWLFLPGLMRTILQVKPQKVLSVDGGANVPVAIISFLLPLRKWKSILSERNILFPPGSGKLKRRLLVIFKFLFYRFADYLTAVSEGVRIDMHKRLRIKASCIKIVYNPMVEPSMLLKAQEPLEHPWLMVNRMVPVLVHAGRFVHQKDHQTLIKAFGIVNEAKPCRLILLGDGPLRSNIEKLVESMNLSDRIEFVGFDLNPFKYFIRCDAFLLSSLHEGMPGVLIQAMACGAPVISTDCPSGPNEIISEPWVNGLLVPIANPEIMAATILKLLTDKKLEKTLRANVKNAVAKFHIDNAIKSYETVIDA